MAAALSELARRTPISTLIGNLETKVEALPFGARFLPVTVNHGASTCYICCPSAAYLDYAAAELRHFGGSMLMDRLLRGLLRLARPLVGAAGLDRQVQPNNWLVATNPLPALDAERLRHFSEALIARWPGHAIVWRSVNRPEDLACFAATGYRALPARQVYLYDCRTSLPPAGRDLKRDLALLRAGAYALVGGESFGTADFERAAALYAKLYLEKYTPLNPRYEAAFLAGCREAGLIDYVGLRDRAGVLQGVAGLFQIGDVLTVPIVGYDTGLPQNEGLYRALMAHCLEKARRERLLFNMSAGAAGFKRNRGAVPAIEYLMVRDAHRPLRQRLARRLVEALLTHVGVPLIRAFEL